MKTVEENIAERINKYSYIRICSTDYCEFVETFCSNLFSNFFNYSKDSKGLVFENLLDELESLNENFKEWDNNENIIIKNFDCFYKDNDFFDIDYKLLSLFLKRNNIKVIFLSFDSCQIDNFRVFQKILEENNAIAILYYIESEYHKNFWNVDVEIHKISNKTILFRSLIESNQKIWYEHILKSEINIKEIINLIKS